MSVVINGKKYAGNNVSMINNKVFIDGVDVTDIGEQEKLKEFHFHIVGDINSLKLEAGDVQIQGNVQGNVKLTSGELQITGDIQGDVEITSGHVKVSGKILGNVDVTCGNVKSY